MSTSLAAPTQFDWQTQPKAACLVHDLLNEACSRSHFLRHLGDRLKKETGTRLIDWIHSFLIPSRSDRKQVLLEAGYQTISTSLYRHQGGLFPDIYLKPEQLFEEGEIFIKVESVADFLLAQGLVETPIEGEAYAVVRRACVDLSPAQKVWVIESHGERGIDPAEYPTPTASLVMKLVHYAEKFRLRKRHFETNAEGFSHTLQLVRQAIQDLGPNRTCDLFFAAERAYWQAVSACGETGAGA